MTLKPIWMTILLLVVGRFTGLQAQQIHLTMQEAVAMAVEQSFDAYSSQYQFQLSKFNYLDTRKLLHPEIRFSATAVNYTRAIQEQWNSDQQQFLPYDVQRLINSGSITLNQPVWFTGGSLNISSSLRRNQTFAENGNTLNYISAPVGVSYRQNFNQPNYYKWNRTIGNLQFEQAQGDLARSQEAVRVRAVSMFFDVLIAQNQVEIARLSKLNADSLQWMAEQKNAIFAISRADYLNLELQQSNSEIAYQKARIRLVNLRNAFTTFLGLSRDVELVCQVPDKVPVISISALDALDKVHANNPELLRIRRAILEAERSLEAARRQPYNVSLQANVGYNQNRNQIDAAYRDLLDQQGVSLSVSIPIYDGGRLSRNVQRARVSQEYQQKSLRQTRLELENEILQQVNNFEVSASQIESYAKSDTLGQVVYEATRERFVLGKASIVDMINAEERRQAARLSYLSQLQSFWTQYYVIRQLCLYDFITQQDLVTLINQRSDD